MKLLLPHHVLLEFAFPTPWAPGTDSRSLFPAVQGDELRWASAALEGYLHTTRRRHRHSLTQRNGLLTSRSSADATIASKATGAMSWAFVTALKKNPQQSYVQLLNSIRDELAKKYTQKPQLSCSHPLGMLTILSVNDLA
jgi:hypothetical protein